ncbi:MAG: DUF1207 domain-containing protein [Deltaproteobacteria bacterium]|nr:DUF1207 domain-containing protein [Deltaproteobacteria bacterium]
MHRTLLRYGTLFCFLLLFLAGQAQGKWAYELFPPKKVIFPPLVADPWETQTSIFFINNYRQIGKIGSSFPIYKSTRQADPSQETETLQLNIEGLSYNSMRFREETGLGNGGIDLDTSDTKFGLTLNYKKNQWHGRFGAEHISAHLADGQLWPTVRHIKRGYSREFLQLNISKSFTYVKPHIGIHSIFTSRHPKEYENKHFVVFQGGGELFYPLSKTFSLILATDWQSRQEYDFFINQSYLAGIRIHGSYEDEVPVKILFQYYQGYDPRGEFYDEKRNYWGFGLQYFI